METKISEIAGGVYRLSTFVPTIAPPPIESPAAPSSYVERSSQTVQAPLAA